MSKLLLIRHGITEGNKKKWFYGHVDLPLLPEGIEELEKQKEEGLYPELPEDALCFTTGLGRTAETFRVIFGDREFEAVKDLREINFGICECKGFNDLKDDVIFQKWMYDEEGDFQIPKGESKNQFRERVHRGFDYVLARHNELVEKKEAAKQRQESEAEKGTDTGTDDITTVVVCHGGVIAEILHRLFPEEKESQWDWMPEPGCGYILDVEEGKVKNPCLLGRVTIY